VARTADALRVDRVPHERELAPIPWGPIVRWAMLGTALMALLVLLPFVAGGRNELDLIRPGRDGPSAAAISEAFPHETLRPGVGLDGQQYYAVARDPLHPSSVARDLDRPWYRLQRPLFPVLAGVIHPDGSASGLITALALVGVLALLLGGIATGVLTTTLGGPPAMAAAFALLPGAYVSLRFTLADALALALSVTAIAASVRGRPRWAVAAGVLAVLTRETSLVLLVGWLLGARRSRQRLALVLIPAAAAASWALYLRMTVPAGGGGSDELAAPFVGLVEATTRIWGHGHELLGMVFTVGAVGLAAFVLARERLGHPLSWMIAVYLLFVTVMGFSVVGMYFGSARSMMPLLLFAMIAVVTPRHRARSGRSSDVVKVPEGSSI
jgi:hypothetical protein